jgi:hypothetical protein
MLKYSAFCLILGLLFASCDAVITIRNQNELTNQTISQDETKTAEGNIFTDWSRWLLQRTYGYNH